MPSIENRRTALAARPGFHKRKNRSVIRRAGSGRTEEKPSAVIANSVFALTLKPKPLPNLYDQEGQMHDPHVFRVYKDLTDSYNHGADLVGSEKIVFNKRETSTTAVANILELFKKNICPKGFDVNIDEHLNKKTRKPGYHFTIYNATEFPQYWHFFEIRHIVNDLFKKNRKLHDLFIVFLRSFIGRCGIPIWFEGSMQYSQYNLAEYTEELREIVHKGLDPTVLEGTGYTEPEITKRLTDIEKTMKEYATGQAHEYMQRIITAKPVKPHYLLRSLKSFPPQHKLVKFMKDACMLMKEKVGLPDFCYHQADGDDDEGLGFDEQVCIIWDWSDHYSATQARHIDESARHLGVFKPTLCARILPTGCGGLEMENIINNLGWTKKLTALHSQFMEIARRFTDYDKDRELI